MSGQEWRDFAVCAQVDTAVFYDDSVGALDLARSICGRCKVTRLCLDDALNDSQDRDWGVRAGTTPGQRRKLRKLRARHLAPVVDLPVPAVPITAEEAAA